MKNSEISIGEIWKRVRKTRGFTQEEVAEKLDLGTRYISDLERGKTIGSINTLIKLCNLYKVTPTYILQKYLDIKEEIKIDPDLISYYSLGKKEKIVIIKLIEFLNKKDHLNQ